MAPSLTSSLCDASWNTASTLTLEPSMQVKQSKLSEFNWSRNLALTFNLTPMCSEDAPGRPSYQLLNIYDPVVKPCSPDCVAHCCVFFHLSESCFRLSLTHRMPPLFCRQGYLKQQGIAQKNKGMHFHFTGPASGEQHAGTSSASAAFPNYLAQAGASMSSGLKLDL